MKIPPVDIRHVAEVFSRAAQEVTEVYEDAGNPVEPSESTPNLMTEAMLQLMDVLQNRGGEVIQTGPEATDDPLSKADIHDLGDYGLNLLAEMSDIASQLKLASRSSEIENLALPFGLWIARQGGELSTLEPLVNTLATLANHLEDPAKLEDLCNMANEIVDATSPALAHDLDTSNPYRPWRILLLNRAILATRSHRAKLMENAFDAINEYLPADAPGFFRDGMEQMELLDYPNHVREVVQRYFNLWSNRRALH